MNCSSQIRSQQQRQRGWKLHSVRKPEVEVHRPRQPSAPCELGFRVSIVSTNGCGPGGQFALHAKTLPGKPYDGHTLASIIATTERLTGRTIGRAYVDNGYRPTPRVSSPARNSACSRSSKASCGAAPAWNQSSAT
jgi:transposase, IS5 family